MKIEKANYIQSGFFCVACGNHVKTYNGLVPHECPSCESKGTLKMEWNQKIEVISKIISLQLVD